MYQSNLNRIVGGVKDKLIALQQNPDAMLRTVALAVLPEVRKRVHVEGKDSSGSQIGIYSTEYMKVRTGSFGNSEKFSRGARRGENKNAGVFTRGAKEGSARPRYNRSSDPKVILSLTRQMENDLSVLPSGSGYGIGFNNPDNFQKSQWNEKTYRKPIWNTTEGEKELAKQTAEAFVADYLNQE
jgi:hypothetical protein